MSLRRLRDFVRGRLWRHMFFWFGLTIIAAVLTTSVITSLTHRYMDNPMRHRVGELTHFIAFKVGVEWDNPAAVHQTMEDARATLHTALVVEDLEHRVVYQAGDCPTSSLPIHDSALGGEAKAWVEHRGARVASLRLCAPPPPPPFLWWRMITPLFVLIVMLGAATHRIAQGLTMPLARLVQVTGEIGAGQLASRAALVPHPPGEVGQLANAINEMAAKLEKQMADQRALLAMVSHELRTPLARLRLLVALAAEPSQLTYDVFAEIEKEVTEIDSIVGTLLASARLDFSIINRQEADARQLFARALEHCEPVVAVDTPDAASWRLAGDVTLIARALANIIENATKYGRGVAKARLRHDGDRIHFEVEDRGEGFTQEHARAFDPFVRATNAGSIDPTSMGLGLTLVKRVAEAHGGTAYAENLSSGGARVGFSVRVQSA